MTKYKTEQRKHLQDFFSEHPHEMFSAKEIEEVLGKESVSISAVYRNLAELEKEGIVRRCTKNGSRETFYQYIATENCKGHIHMTCKKCGTTIHMKLEDSDALAKNAMKYKNFIVDKTDTVLIGVCGKCQTL